MLYLALTGIHIFFNQELEVGGCAEENVSFVPIEHDNKTRCQKKCQSRDLTKSGTSKK